MARKRVGRHAILAGLFSFCALLYYFGQAVDQFGWQAIRWQFWYAIHDMHRLLFMFPIAWAGYYLGTAGIVLVTLASVAVFLPRAIWVSPFPDALPRAVLAGIVQGAIGWLAIRLRAAGGCKNEGPAALAPEADDKFRGSGLQVDAANRLVMSEGKAVRLTRIEYELLSCLVTNAGKVVRHREILRAVWGPEYGHEKEYLHTFIAQLRRKLEPDPANPQLILTDPGLGYRFVLPRKPTRSRWGPRGSSQKTSSRP